MHFEKRENITVKIPRSKKDGSQDIITYSFYLLKGRRAGIIAGKLIGKFAAGLSNFYKDSNVSITSIENMFDEDILEYLYELIFSEECKLKADGEFIQDPDEYFGGRVAEMYMVIGQALRYNCQDFFPTALGLLKKNKHCLEILLNLREKEVVSQEVLNHLGITKEILDSAVMQNASGNHLE